jgi:uncharacterized protein YqgV (UPF0045/DUF77 family)
MNKAQVKKLNRILGLLGSDQVGERAAAALAAHKMMTSLGVTWEDLLERANQPTEVVRTIVRHVNELDIDEARAAESRMRQLRQENQRLEQETKRLKNRLAAMAEQARKARLEEWDEQ